jgi:hypothetical protein
MKRRKRKIVATYKILKTRKYLFYNIKLPILYTIKILLNYILPTLSKHLSKEEAYHNYLPDRNTKNERFISNNELLIAKSSNLDEK